MKKTEMIKKNYEFKAFFSRGKCYYGKYIIVYIFENKYKKNKLGIAVGKKAENSVRRHRIRRLIKENYRLLEEKMREGKNILIVWNQKAKYEEANFFSIKNDMEEIFKKIGVI